LQKPAEAVPHFARKDGGPILNIAFAEAKEILIQHRNQLDLVAGELLEHETLDGNSFQCLLQQEPKAQAVHHGKDSLLRPHVTGRGARLAGKN
jgi:hypothetical protein